MTITPISLGLQAEHIGDLVHEFGETNLRGFQCQFARFDFGDVE